jgi:hypothetical protein
MRLLFYIIFALPLRTNHIIHPRFLFSRVRYFAMASERWTTKAQVDAALADLPSDAARVKALKDQINIYVKGFGWAEFKTPFSCHTDASIGSVAHLTAAVKDIIGHTARREPPPSAKLPTTRTAKIGVLGTLTPETQEMKERGWSSEQLRTQFDDIRQEMEDKLRAKNEARHDSHSLAQPAEAPTCDAALIGKNLEVLTQVQEEEDDEEGGSPVMRYYNQWLPATVVRVSDGSDTQADRAGRQRKVKPGWFLLSYDDGESIWTRLKEEDFNCARLGSWRLDLDAGLPPALMAGGGGAEVGQGEGEGEPCEGESEVEEEEGAFDDDEEEEYEEGEYDAGDSGDD